MGETETPAIPPRLDHVVIATPTLDETVADFTARTGVRPAAGGAHPDRGTRNYLVSFGGDSYLEIIGPDSARTVGDDALTFGLAALREPRVAAWAVHPADIDEAAAHIGPVGPGQRRTTTGELLEWRLTEPPNGLPDGVVPFLIDWGTTTSPAVGPPEVELVSFTGSHPDPGRVRPVLTAIGTSLRLATGPAGLALTLAGEHGLVEFR
ncbi:VOC family protein [Saccharopolyspora shandongensis]|uniref:VOC family protein n=1 Tax=Saccharopolyspora shandongensis TaxID=418495 RepID=UPI0033DE792C